MRPACLILFLHVLALPVAWGANPLIVFNDSIVIDGTVIQVEAQVRFDSLPQSSARPAFDPTWSVCAMTGVGTDWAYWSGQRDVALGLEMQWLKRTLHRDFRSKTTVWVEGTLGAMLTSNVEVDQGTFPDSLIGFLPATSNQPLRFVTSQQFDIGTETDTSSVTTIRSASFMPYAALGLTGEKKGWSFRMQAGIQFFPSSTALRIVLNEPSLTEPPFVPGAFIEGQVLPRFESAVGYRPPRSPWMFRIHGTALPGAPQNLWVGFGVTYIKDAD